MVDAAKGQCERSVVSIFVNSMQFGEGEDFDSYPRTLKEDQHKLEQAGVDLLFAPRGRRSTPRAIKRKPGWKCRNSPIFSVVPAARVILWALQQLFANSSTMYNRIWQCSVRRIISS